MPLLKSSEKKQLQTIDTYLGNLIGSVLEAVGIAPWEISLEKNLQIVCQKHKFARSVFDIQQWSPPTLEEEFYEQNFVIMHRNLYRLLASVIGTSTIATPSFLKTLESISLLNIIDLKQSNKVEIMHVQFQLNFLNNTSSVFNVAFFTSGSCQWVQYPTLINVPTLSLTSVSSLTPSGHSTPIQREQMQDSNDTPIILPSFTRPNFPQPQENLTREFIDTLYANCPTELQRAWKELLELETEIINASYISQEIEPIKQKLILRCDNNLDKSALEGFCYPEKPSRACIEYMILLVSRAIVQEHTTLLLAKLTSKRKTAAPCEELNTGLYDRCPLKLKLIWNQLTTSQVLANKEMLRPICLEFIAACRTHYMIAELTNFCVPVGNLSPRNIEKMINRVLEAIKQEQKAFSAIQTAPKPQSFIFKRTLANQTLFDNCLPTVKAVWFHVLKHPETTHEEVKESLKNIRDSLIASIDNKALDPQDAIAFCQPDPPSREVIRRKFKDIYAVIKKERDFLFATNQRIK